jgi:hypothetical protein
MIVLVVVVVVGMAVALVMVLVVPTGIVVMIATTAAMWIAIFGNLNADDVIYIGRHDFFFDCWI